MQRRELFQSSCPIDDEVKFTKEAGAYNGMFVRDADKNVAEDLKVRGALVALRKIRHKYPLCWRISAPTRLAC